MIWSFYSGRSWTGEGGPMATTTETAVTAVADEAPVTDADRKRFRDECQAQGLRFTELEIGEFDEMVRQARKGWGPTATK